MFNLIWLNLWLYLDNHIVGALACLGDSVHKVADLEKAAVGVSGVHERLVHLQLQILNKVGKSIVRHVVETMQRMREIFPTRLKSATGRQTALLCRGSRSEDCKQFLIDLGLYVIIDGRIDRLNVSLFVIERFVQRTNNIVNHSLRPGHFFSC